MYLFTGGGVLGDFLDKAGLQRVLGKVNSKISSSISGIEVGGRNLLLDTGNGLASSHVGVATDIATVTISGQLDSNDIPVAVINATRKVETSGYFVLCYSIPQKVKTRMSSEAGRSLTLGFDMAIEGMPSSCASNAISSMQISETTGLKVLALFGKGNKAFHSGGARTFVWGTGEISSGVSVTSSQLLYINMSPLLNSLPVGSSVTIWWEHLKLEYGNKPTDWSPAPADLQTSAITNDEVDAQFKAVFG